MTTLNMELFEVIPENMPPNKVSLLQIEQSGNIAAILQHDQ